MTSLPSPEPVEVAQRRSRQPRRLGAWRVAGDLPTSFRYAAKGLSYSFSSQRNFRIHVVTGAIVFALGLWLGLSLERLAVLVLTVAAVLGLELPFTWRLIAHGTVVGTLRSDSRGQGSLSRFRGDSRRTWLAATESQQR